MTHRTATIDCTPREAEAVASGFHSYVVTMPLGGGKEHRFSSPSFPAEEIVEAATRHGRGVMVYGVATLAKLDVTVLAATYHPKKGWKYAEGFNP